MSPEREGPGFLPPLTGLMDLLLNRNGLRTLWIIGTLERLSTLGYLQEVPLCIPSSYIDLYLGLSPESLFEGEDDLRETLRVLILEQDERNAASEEEINTIADLVLRYKEDPIGLVKEGAEAIAREGYD